MTEKPTFSINDKYKFWKNKWLCEHTGSIIITLFLTLLIFCAISFFSDKGILAFLPVVFMVEYCYFRNKMIIYVENKIYDKIKKEFS